MQVTKAKATTMQRVDDHDDGLDAWPDKCEQDVLTKSLNQQQDR